MNSEINPQETPEPSSEEETLDEPQEKPADPVDQSVEAASDSESVEAGAAGEVVLAHEDDDGGGYGPPRGALAFVFVLLAGYVLYWIMIYSQILGHGR